MHNSEKFTKLRTILHNFALLCIIVGNNKQHISQNSNILESGVILCWKARLIQNSKFKVVESNVDNLYSHANPQVKSKKNQAQVVVNPKLNILTILATYTSIQNFRLRVKNTTKSRVIHHWKAKVMQNKKMKLWSILRIYTFRQNIRLNIKSSVICQ